MESQNGAPETKRDRIGITLIIASGAGIVVLGTVALVAGFSADDGKRTFVMAIFNALIPLFGTWVGTVVAYYFSRENFATAAQATRDLVGQLADERLRKVLVKDAWVPVTAIEAVKIDKGKTAQDIAFSSVLKMLSTKVSRVPIWDSDMVILYIIHESMIYKFDSRERNATATLADFLKYEDMESIVTRLAYVAKTATLADAKLKMNDMPGCQDIVVTATGQRTEPVLGWITNAAIASREHV